MGTVVDAVEEALRTEGPMTSRELAGLLYGSEEQSVIAKMGSACVRLSKFGLVERRDVIDLGGGRRAILWAHTGARRWEPSPTPCRGRWRNAGR